MIYEPEEEVKKKGISLISLIERARNIENQMLKLKKAYKKKREEESKVLGEIENKIKEKYHDKVFRRVGKGFGKRRIFLHKMIAIFYSPEEAKDSEHYEIIRRLLDLRKTSGVALFQCEEEIRICAIRRSLLEYVRPELTKHKKLRRDIKLISLKLNELERENRTIHSLIESEISHVYEELERELEKADKHISSFSSELRKMEDLLELRKSLYEEEKKNKIHAIKGLQERGVSLETAIQWFKNGTLKNVVESSGIGEEYIKELKPLFEEKIFLDYLETKVKKLRSKMCKFERYKEELSFIKNKLELYSKA